MRLQRYVVTAAFFLLIVGGVVFGISMYSANTPAVKHVRLTADLDGDDKPMLHGDHEGQVRAA